VNNNVIYDPYTLPATATQRAIWFSVKISDRLRSEVGAKGDVLSLWTHLSRMFPDAEERAEAQRLLELAARIHKRVINYADVQGVISEGLEASQLADS
jgi:hypothetical protein